MNNHILLKINKLNKVYKVQSASFFTKAVVHAVNDVSFDIKQGEILGLVGESGSGKTTIGKQIVGLEKPTSGTIQFHGRDIMTFKPKDKKTNRVKIQMIFQDSYSSLNPRRNVFDILAKPILVNRITSKRDVAVYIDHLLDIVGLSRNSIDKYPHEFSGGQRQRIGIARALSLKPELLVCDEPVSALDVSIQAQILNLLKEIREELNISMLFIGHGLGAVSYVSDRIAVMTKGRIVEIAESVELFKHPVHPYTKILKEAIPIANPLIKSMKVEENDRCLWDPDDESPLQLIDLRTAHYVKSSILKGKGQ
ncbi:ATP-binding cassette domain-containing protein [Sporolactobacillus pectinivorans]|uniref:ATP-binding cassette domain-containing protein n=1 Tax=Sporolactobacillus pectinivorans TaxID=1591408 RepID=UPI000C25D4A4|nr:ATP-binding cassette domain-containing protein [Sporolactobacillus pectinivorans]